MMEWAAVRRRLPSGRRADAFKRGIEPLADAGKLGALLAQFPAAFRANTDNRVHLASVLRAFGGYRVAVEQRTLHACRDGAAGRRGARGRCCTNPHWPARCQPTGSSPADAIRHWSAEGGHPIEDFAAEDHFTPLPGWAPGAKAISDDGFVSEERILHPALTMVP